MQICPKYNPEDDFLGWLLRAVEALSVDTNQSLAIAAIVAHVPGQYFCYLPRNIQQLTTVEELADEVITNMSLPAAVSFAELELDSLKLPDKLTGDSLK